ncbi:MAG TPA: efflux RND transporter permease subunit [Chthonomonadaceae bacterium]|nr:efflux RND transporter permease subunit [Chthonomonadaceae bacterium]
MSLTKFALRNRPLTYVLLAAILGMGLLATFLLPRREDPDMQGRFVQIIALYPGANAGQMEELVTDKLERSLLELDDIKTVTSTSRAGITVLQVETSDQVKDIKKFRDDLRNRVGDIRSSLPQGVISVDVNDRFADTAALILGVTQEGATDRQREDTARRIRDRLRRLSDVSEVNLLGEQQERLTISLSAQRMAQLAMTPAQVSEAIARRNILPSSGGSIALGNTRLSIEPSGDLSGVQDLQSLVVATPNGAPVTLRDIATVTRDYADPSPFLMRVNGKPAVGVTITMRKGRNIQALGASVNAELAKLRSELPTGAEVTTINDLPRSVERRMGEFTENLVSGVVLIFVVMYLFMGMRSALIVGSMLPITILGTFALMYLFARDIQQISISALIIALGLVVDNSIVVVDNIERKLSQGLSREKAAIEGVDELRVPLLTSNLTTVASFAPILLLSGGVGEFIRDLGIVTSLATLISLLFNLTIAPLIAQRFLKGAHEERPNAVRRGLLWGVDRLRDGIAFVAERGLRRPVFTVGVATVGLILAIALIPRLGTQFFPSAERDQFVIDVWLPEGRDILATQKTAARVEKILRAQQGVRSFVTYVGQGGPRFYYNVSPEAQTPNYAQIVVNTEGIEITRRLVPLVQQAADATISEARITAKTLEQGPPVGAPIAVRVMGDNLNDLRYAGEQIKTILNGTPGATSAYHNYGELPLALKVNINEEQRALAGLSAADIAQATQMGFSGMTASYLREGDKEIPIQLRLDPKERSGANALGDLYLPSSTGAVVPLRQVASLALAPEEGRIVRRNHVRTLTVYAYTDGSRLASQILADAQKRIAVLPLPKGVTLGYGGEQEEVGRSFTELLLILGLTVIANLVIVIWEFNSFRAALTILVAIPFSLTGAVLGLYVMHLPFGFMAFLGITSLSGVVTNHAIVLFEYALVEQRNGVSLDQALLVAGRKRLRPILLTVLLSIFGVLPQAVNGGTFWPPLAWSLIFGLLMSLLLTLVIVPSFYKLLSLRQAKHPNEAIANREPLVMMSLPQE